MQNDSVKKNKVMFPRIYKKDKQNIPNVQGLNKYPKGPGIFFDMQKGLQYEKIQNVKKIITRHKSEVQVGQDSSQQAIQATAAAAVSSAGGFIHLTDKNSQKMYSPYEYLHYATKINHSKENYLSALSQLGYSNVNDLNEKSYHDILNRTQNVIQNTYSQKYIGVIDGNMGILSKRVKINDTQRELSSSKKNNGQAQKNSKNNQDKEKDVEAVQHSNISKIPQQYRPDLYNSYMITQYSLPKYLKPIIKEKNQSVNENKLRLDKWHEDQLRANTNFLQNDTLDEASQQIAGANNLSSSRSMNIMSTNYHGKIKPKRLISQRQLSPRGNQSQESINKYFYEVPEESLFCAVIDKPNDVPVNQSYSRLINNITQMSIEQQNSDRKNNSIIPTYIKSIKNTQSNNEYLPNLRNQNNSIKFTQNQQLHDRFDHIAKYLQLKNKQ